MLSGPSFMDSFFNSSTGSVVEYMGISHEEFSFLLSVPSLTGVVSAIAGLIVALYGSTLSAIFSGMVSLSGSIIVLYGIYLGNYATVMVGRIMFNMFWSLLQSFQTVLMFKLFTGPTLAWVYSLQIIAIRVGTAGGFFCAGRFMDYANDSIVGAFALAVGVSSTSFILSLAFAYLYRGSKTAQLVRPLMMGNRRTGIGSSNEINFHIPRNAVFLCGVIFLYYAGFTTFESFGVDFMNSKYGFDKDSAGSMMSSLVLISLLSPFIAPVLCNTTRQLRSMGIATIVVASAIFALANGPVEDQTRAYIILVGLGTAHMFVVSGLWLSLAGVCSTDSEKAHAASIGSAVNCISTCTTCWITGRLRDVTGNYVLAYSILATFVLAASVLGWTVVATYTPPIDESSRDKYSIDKLSAEESFEEPLAEYLLCDSVVDEDHFSSRHPYASPIGNFKA
jgi:MFS family permease